MRSRQRIQLFTCGRCHSGIFDVRVMFPVYEKINKKRLKQTVYFIENVYFLNENVEFSLGKFTTSCYRYKCFLQPV